MTAELDAKAIGRRLRELRGFDLSQNAAAEGAGVSVAALSLYETGQRIPGGEIAVKLAAFYNTSTDYIFLGKN